MRMKFLQLDRGVHRLTIERRIKSESPALFQAIIIERKNSKTKRYEELYFIYPMQIPMFERAFELFKKEQKFHRK